MRKAIEVVPYDECISVQPVVWSHATYYRTRYACHDYRSVSFYPSGGNLDLMVCLTFLSLNGS